MYIHIGDYMGKLILDTNLDELHIRDKGFNSAYAKCRMFKWINRKIYQEDIDNLHPDVEILDIAACSNEEVSKFRIRPGLKIYLGIKQ